MLFTFEICWWTSGICTIAAGDFVKLENLHIRVIAARLLGYILWQVHWSRFPFSPPKTVGETRAAKPMLSQTKAVSFFCFFVLFWKNVNLTDQIETQRRENFRMGGKERRKNTMRGKWSGREKPPPPPLSPSIAFGGGGMRRWGSSFSRPKLSRPCRSRKETTDPGKSCDALRSRCSGKVCF